MEKETVPLNEPLNTHLGGVIFVLFFEGFLGNNCHNLCRDIESVKLNVIESMVKQKSKMTQKTQK